MWAFLPVVLLFGSANCFPLDSNNSQSILEAEDVTDLFKKIRCEFESELNHNHGTHVNEPSNAGVSNGIITSGKNLGSASGTAFTNGNATSANGVINIPGQGSSSVTGTTNTSANAVVGTVVGNASGAVPAELSTPPPITSTTTPATTSTSTTTPNNPQPPPPPPTSPNSPPGSAPAPSVTISLPGSAPAPSITLTPPGSGTPPSLTLNVPGPPAPPSVAIHPSGPAPPPVPQPPAIIVTMGNPPAFFENEAEDSSISNNPIASADNDKPTLMTAIKSNIHLQYDRLKSNIKTAIHKLETFPNFAFVW